MKKQLSPNKQQLLTLEKTEKYVFHGSPEKVSIFEPRQAYDNWKPDWAPATFATEKVEIAIFRALINRHRGDIEWPSKSSFSHKNGAIFYTLTQNLLNQAQDKIWYIHVFTKSDFSHFTPIECKSFNHVTPLQVISITVDDLPKGINIIE